MTVAVILDGPGAGYTEEEWKAVRDLDMQVAKAVAGFGVIMETFYEPLHYSTDMNECWILLKWILNRYRHSARCIFFQKLQEQGSFDESRKTAPQYPDVITTIVNELPKHICLAYLAAEKWFSENDFNPEEPTKAAQKFADAVECELIEEVDPETGAVTKRLNAKPASAPWVHLAKPSILE